MSQVPQKQTLRWAHVGRSSRRKCSLEKAVGKELGCRGNFGRAYFQVRSQPQSQPQKTPGLMLLGRIYPTPRQGARFPNSSPGQHWPQASQGNVSLDSWFSAPPTLPSAVLWRKLWGTEAGSWRSGQRIDNAIPQSLYYIDTLWRARKKNQTLNVFQLYLNMRSIFSPQYFSYWFSVKHSMRNAAYILLSLANFKGLRRPEVKIV